MPELTEAQKAIRGSRIGASEVGAIIPPYIHPWTDRARIFARIIDGPDEPISNAYMTAGHQLERAIGQVAATKLGLRLRSCWRTYVHDELPLAATPDFYATDAEGGQGLLEVKLSREWSDWLDGPPPYVLWQVRTQLLLTGRPWAIIAALVGTTLHDYRIEREEMHEDTLRYWVTKFEVDHLATRIPPATKEEPLMLRWSLKAGELVAEGELARLGHNYAVQVRQRRRVEAWEKEARAAFVAELASAGAPRLVLGNGWNATVDERGILRFDVKRRPDG